MWPRLLAGIRVVEGDVAVTSDLCVNPDSYVRED